MIRRLFGRELSEDPGPNSTDLLTAVADDSDVPPRVVIRDFEGSQLVYDRGQLRINALAYLAMKNKAEEQAQD